ncbi:rod shape-determining protein, partial [Enterobacter asburiae]|nr:rod shape-determining protein [Enterobacter asburiae]
SSISPLFFPSKFPSSFLFSPPRDLPSLSLLPLLCLLPLLSRSSFPLGSSFSLAPSPFFPPSFSFLSLPFFFSSSSVRLFGARFSSSLLPSVRRNSGSLIGAAPAERLKPAIGSASPGDEVREIAVRGRNLAEGV